MTNCVKNYPKGLDFYAISALILKTETATSLLSGCRKICHARRLPSLVIACSNKSLERVFRMQKRAARIILGAEYMTRTVTMFNKLNWIPYYNEAYLNRCMESHLKE